MKKFLFFLMFCPIAKTFAQPTCNEPLPKSYVNVALTNERSKIFNNYFAKSINNGFIYQDYSITVFQNFMQSISDSSYNGLRIYLASSSPQTGAGNIFLIFSYTKNSGTKTKKDIGIYWAWDGNNFLRMNESIDNLKKYCANYLAAYGNNINNITVPTGKKITNTRALFFDSTAILGIIKESKLNCHKNSISTVRLALTCYTTKENLHDMAANYNSLFDYRITVHFQFIQFKNGQKVEFPLDETRPRLKTKAIGSFDTALPCPPNSCENEGADLLNP